MTSRVHASRQTCPAIPACSTDQLCHVCSKRVYNRARYQRVKHTEHEQAIRRAANARRDPSKVALTRRRWVARNREHANWYARTYRTGFTKEYFELRMLEQRGCCAICEREFTDRRKPNCDHDHITQAPRAVLCSTCNLRVGVLETETELTRLCRAYIAEWNARLEAA